MIDKPFGMVGLVVVVFFFFFAVTLSLARTLSIVFYFLKEFYLYSGIFFSLYFFFPPAIRPTYYCFFICNSFPKTPHTHSYT